MTVPPIWHLTFCVVESSCYLVAWILIRQIKWESHIASGICFFSSCYRCALNLSTFFHAIYRFVLCLVLEIINYVGTHFFQINALISMRVLVKTDKTVRIDNINCQTHTATLADYGSAGIRATETSKASEQMREKENTIWYWRAM